MGNMAALYMHHVTIEGVRLSGDLKLAPCGQTSIPWGHGSVENIPMHEMFFLCNKVKSGCSDYYKFCLVTFIVESRLAPFVGYRIGVRSVLLAHFVPT